MQAVLITGCSSGIGLCLAQGLKQAGYRVFATARKTQDVEMLIQLGFESYQLDLSSSKSIKQATKAIYEQVDELYGLIHNGAYGQVGALEDVSRKTLEAQFQANVFGWHELTNLVLPGMKDSNNGRIIYLSSVLGFVAMPFRGSYNASKFAIEGLVDTLRLELMNTNVQLSLIQPGPIESKFRINAYLAFKANIDMDNSDYQSNYKQMIERLKSDKLADYTLPAESILKCTLHALRSPKAKIRYWVTFPTKLFAVLKRILPSRIMDKILVQAGGGGKR
ncbi:Putative NAD(P)-dependent oxidoreductase EC-YbbO [uncultured Gammaproteobacteria bacterium]|uniref:SDR family NAD(P)-dependent oxidoreductase n=1 Tax=Bathymodiolus heckerae thiotrophic gill symbiont TaxID=1052212 RepID=UPI0010B3C05D|nr:SDR family NAD(P)-dependent oxidoreductase [Bathymodiolus heckerae thiotrophic gill symbiont]CAC9529820.1 Putative NAD(P)-dependent oxidoreductase EC-YbbO [uncultured Gammaproteobacteria bacterium]CAC9581480.1 Putative NAD(P)-dependent oxidoreductase EC-YbbO [uncultured Gammaproteobacteria bacterium]CAC9590275.1 Putative NAD(P)-dependent oxidoreductase EC-YbbO [uncultured Gammaproteobacteria bacterium]CAC9592772.1 Putative NAD(P)-dependent oxidoreductase EC-YbbO [uncultured Gammaproteobacter